jgi:N-methylhydantoinase A
MIRVGFDIGGTFTDLVLHDARGHRMVVHKTPTTPGNLAEAVMQGLSSLLDQAAIAPGDVAGILHATTIATNAILERKGSRTGLITTRGFRDVLLIGRQKRYDTYDLYLDKPEPLTKRRYIFEVDERLGFDGAIIAPLDMASVDRAIDALLDAEVESVAVVLMHAYANPEHEAAIGRRLAERAPSLSVSLSSDVSAKYREYERTSTSVANAYVRPIVERYLTDLAENLTGRGFPRDLMIMQSNGGLVSPELARRYPIRIVESGPAAGVMMCAAVGRDEGFDHILTFDMGGTTAKLGAVDNGEPAVTPTFEVDNRHFRKFSGLPINVPAIELMEIGAGGGSIAGVDFGLIKVGPQSAGAEPGPMCYGRGGDRPTVTDANLVLGYLNPDYFNGGAMTLDAAAAAEGIRSRIAEPLGVSPGMAAWGIHAMANSNMETAMRVISVERGRDPRRYAMVAFGGAGPVHAAFLARALGIPKVIVPDGAGVGSAIGLLNADSRIDVSMTRIATLDAEARDGIARLYGELEQRAAGELANMAGDAPPEWSRYAYLRHKGQGSEIKVDLPDGPVDGDFTDRVTAAFYDAYERNYGYRDPEATVEGVDWHLVATIRRTPDAVALSGDVAAGTAAPGDAMTGIRDAYFPGMDGYVSSKVVDRYRMAPGERIEGPAIIEERESTTVVPPGDVAFLSEHGHLVILIAAEEG